jgi:hypothetical protein
MVHNTSKLDPLVAEYEKLQLACTDLVDNYISLRRRGKPLKPKKVTVLGAAMGAWGREKYGVKPVKVDAFEFYRWATCVLLSFFLFLSLQQGVGGEKGLGAAEQLLAVHARGMLPPGAPPLRAFNPLARAAPASENPSRHTRTHPRVRTPPPPQGPTD